MLTTSELPQIDPGNSDASPTIDRRSALTMGLAMLGSALLPRATAFGEGRAAEGGPVAPVARSTASIDDRAEWQYFRDMFVSLDGRAVDAANGRSSSSEGQGYALLLADWAADRDSFERILHWTETHLARSADSLHAWAWTPRGPGRARKTGVDTLGELYIAWALLRAADRWGVPAWRSQATAIADDLLDLVARQVDHRILLTSGKLSRDNASRAPVHPAHYHFPAIRALAAATGDGLWRRIDRDGMWLLDHARFGDDMLPADRVDVSCRTGEVLPPRGRPLIWSWDALRVPLNLVWAGESAASALTSLAAYWNSPSGNAQPAWIDLKSGDRASFGGHPGLMAIAAISLATVAGGDAAPDLPGQQAGQDFYPSALAMLARVAWQERPASRSAGAPASG